MNNGIYCIPLHKEIQDAPAAAEAAQDASCIGVSEGDGVPDRPDGVRDEAHDAVPIRDADHRDEARTCRDGDHGVPAAGEEARTGWDNGRFRRRARCR